MTLLQVYEALLIEQNKRKAPSLLLADFNYFVNKAINNYEATRYLLYDKDQLSVDDLGAIKVVDWPITLTKQGLYYKGTLPTNYLHMLNCLVEFKSNADYSCYEANEIFTKKAQRLPSSSARHIEDNYYFKPSYKQPYFYQNGNLLEMRSGDTTILTPQKVYIDYLKTPKIVTLTQEQIDSITDTSEVMEFSYTVCLQIINELVQLVLEQTSDQRLQTNTAVNQKVPLNR